MLKVTSTHCKRARGLLGWNHRDLSHRSGVEPHRINSFERGLLHLRQDENKHLYDAFKDEGICFEEYGEVRLDKSGGKGAQETQNTSDAAQHRQEERIHIDEEEYRRLTGLEGLGSRHPQGGHGFGKHTPPADRR